MRCSSSGVMTSVRYGMNQTGYGGTPLFGPTGMWRPAHRGAAQDLTGDKAADMVAA
jgi:hypothetical protein